MTASLPTHDRQALDARRPDEISGIDRLEAESRRPECFIERQLIKLGYYAFCAILAQVSRSETVRLKTSAPAVESGSTLKYPSRSN